MHLEGNFLKHKEEAERTRKAELKEYSSSNRSGPSRVGPSKAKSKDAVPKINTASKVMSEPMTEATLNMDAAQFLNSIPYMSADLYTDTEPKTNAAQFLNDTPGINAIPKEDAGSKADAAPDTNAGIRATAQKMEIDMDGFLDG